MNKYIVVVSPGFNYSIKKFILIKTRCYSYSYAVRKFNDNYKTFLFDIQHLCSESNEKSKKYLYDNLDINSKGKIVYLLHADYNPMQRKTIIKSRKNKQIIKPALFEIHMSQSSKKAQPHVFHIRGNMIKVFRYINSNWITWRNISYLT